MSKIKAVFFGTHDFAATILELLLTYTHISLETIYTQPDRKVGRKQILEESPVKKLAKKYNLNIAQPESLKDVEIAPTSFDLAIVAQYGLIIPKNIIEAFPRGMINVHGSLLPKYRGASPIQMAIKNGEELTGITIMLMDEQVDHGPILSQEGVVIAPDDTFVTLSHKMALEGSKLLLNTLTQYLNLEIVPTPQDHSQATFTTLINKNDGKVDFSKTAQEIYNLYRAFSLWPGIWCVWEKKRVKLLRIIKAEENLAPGEVLIKNKRIFVGCGQGSIEVLELQLEGKNAMSAEVFANGYKNLNSVNLI
jgi:methionyl-tRNA formyltransferase